MIPTLFLRSWILYIKLDLHLEGEEIWRGRKMSTIDRSNWVDKLYIYVVFFSRVVNGPLLRWNRLLNFPVSLGPINSNVISAKLDLIKPHLHLEGEEINLKRKMTADRSNCVDKYCVCVCLLISFNRSCSDIYTQFVLLLLQIGDII